MLLLGLPWRAAGCLLARMDGWRGGIEWTGSLCFELGCRGGFKVGVLILLRIFEGWAWEVGVASRVRWIREGGPLGSIISGFSFVSTVVGLGMEVASWVGVVGVGGFAFSCRVAVLLHL